MPISDDKNNMLQRIRKMIEEGALKFPNDTPLFNTLKREDTPSFPIMFPNGNFIATDPALEPPKPLYVKIHYGQMYISDTSDADIDERIYQTFWDTLSKKQRDSLLLPNWEDTPNIVTTVSSTPTPSLTTESLKDTIERLPKDPLLEKGVQRDWVCVINPALVSYIEGFYEAHKPKHFVPMRKLDYVLGRRVFVINEAPLNIEYMAEKTMRLKYTEHFLRELELLQQQEDDKTEE